MGLREAVPMLGWWPPLGRQLSRHSSRALWEAWGHRPCAGGGGCHTLLEVLDNEQLTQ